ncbi:NUDIX domain-containing protein [Streptomyces sp. 4N509B]|uniref:NUDIX domain-containing protein n=1 Tax=Streptomyces sp. 4N509B TaxID=3457413 RepID=UPI003FD150DC
MTYTYGRHVTHCPFCGVPYDGTAGWPRDCAGCGETLWLNPLPVAVALLPVEREGRTGLVVVRRDIEPFRGELALPGGYMELGETWREAAVRELREETGLVASPDDVTLVDVREGDRTLNVFALLAPRRADSLPEPAATPEATEWLVIDAPVPLAFPTHQAVVEAYFAGEGAVGRPALG